MYQSHSLWWWHSTEWVWSDNLDKGRAIQRAHYPLNHCHKERDNSYFLATLAHSFTSNQLNLHSPSLAMFWQSRISGIYKVLVPSLRTWHEGKLNVTPVFALFNFTLILWVQLLIQSLIHLSICLFVVTFFSRQFVHIYLFEHFSFSSVYNPGYKSWNGHSGAHPPSTFQWCFLYKESFILITVTIEQHHVNIEWGRGAFEKYLTRIVGRL